MAAPQSPEPRCPLNGMGQCFGDHDPQTLPGSDDSFLGRDGGAALVPHDFVKDLRHGKATGASSPLAPLGNIPVLERKRRA